MTEQLPWNKRLQWLAALIPFAAVIYFAKNAGDVTTEFFTPLLIAVTPLVVWALFARVEVVYYSVIFLIPLSIPRTVGVGFVMSFPSEALTAVLFSYLVLCSLIHPVFNRRLLTHPLMILFLTELGWMIVCSITSSDPLVSFKRVIVRTLFLYLFLLFAAHQLLKKPGREHWLFILYAVGLLWPVMHSISFHAEYEFSRPAAYKMPLPFFADHTIYGACIAFLLPMLLILTFGNATIRLRGIYHWLIIGLTMFLVVAEVLSFSRAAWLSLLFAGVFGLLLLLRVRLRTVLVSLAVLGLITYAYNDELYTAISKNDAISTKGDIKEHMISVTNVQSDASNTERINRWLCAWRMGVEKPIVGFGPGMYQFEYGKFQEREHMTRISTFSGNKGHAHSEYFTPLSETGFTGFILFLVIVFAVVGYGMKAIYNETNRRTKAMLYGAVLGLITFYVHGVFNAFLDTDKMAVLVFGAIAVIISSTLRQAENGHLQPSKS